MEQFYEGCEKLPDGRYRLVEKFMATPDRYQALPLTEAMQVITEAKKSYPCRGAYTFKIWEIDKQNLNKRIYSRALAEKIIQENQVTLGLSDHPKSDEDGNPDDTFAVERNPRIINGWLCADFYLVGEKGQLVKEVLDAEGPVMVSSSGLGNCDHNGVVMLEYELERYGDHVTRASNGYKHYKDESEIRENLNDIDIKNNTILENNNKNNEVKKSMPKNTDTKKLSLEEKNFISYMERNLKDLEEKDLDINKRIDEYNQLLEWCNDSSFDFAKEIRGQIETKLTELHTKKDELAIKGVKTDSLEKDLNESTKTIEQLSAENNTLLEKIEVLSQRLDEAKELISKMEVMNERFLGKMNTMVETKEYKQALDEKEGKQVIIEKYQEQLSNVSSELKALKEKHELMIKEIDSKKKVEEAIINNSKKYTFEVLKVQRENKIKFEKEKQLEAEKIEQAKLAEQTINLHKFDYRIKELYADWFKNDNRIEKIKDQILACKTIDEAYMTRMKLSHLYEDKIDPKSVMSESQIILNQEKANFKSILDKPCNDGFDWNRANPFKNK